jgi:hypothetical protein
VDELKELQSEWRNYQWPSLIQSLQLLSHVSSLAFFFCDNLVWASSIQLIKDRWGFKRLKDLCSLIRCLLMLVISLLARRHHLQSLQQHRSAFLESPDSFFSHRSPSFEALEKSLALRKDLGYIHLRFVQNIFRLCMLVKSLRLPGNARLSAVFVSVCGIMASGLNVFKLLLRGK